jgi:hypothetical protein
VFVQRNPYEITQNDVSKGKPSGIELFLGAEITHHLSGW